MDDFENNNNRGVLSSLLLWWIIPILKKGRKGLLSDTDLHAIPKNLECLPDQVEMLCKREFKADRKQKITATDIMYSVLNMIKTDLFVSLLMCFSRHCILSLAFPIMMGRLLKQMKSETYDRYQEVQLALIVITILLIMPLFRSVFTRYSVLCGIKSRYALNSLLYNKVMKLTTVAHSKVSSGKIINLMSSNFNVMEKLFLQACFIPIILIQTIFATIFIWRQFGPSSSAGILIFLLVIPVQFFAGRIALKIRTDLSSVTDKRIKIVNDILKGIKVIKMYTWENIFVQIISSKRRTESAYAKKLMMITSLNLGVSQMIVKLVTLLIITTFLLNNGDLTSDKVFVMLSLIYSMKISRSSVFAQAISSMSAAITSIQRLQSILDLEEALNVADSLNKKGSFNPETCISILNVSASWRKELCVLKDINVYTSKNEFVTIIGSVGSGKSSLLLLMLNELRPHHGSVAVSGNIAYVSQEPWIFADTVVNNITFGEKFDHKKLDRIIDVCSLKHDIKSLPYGYHTSVGERGTALSGGQKARVSLARALYQDADIYILDDPLSAVDANVGRRIQQECFDKYLKNKIRILVTNQLQYVQDNHKILFVEKGCITFCGTYSECLKNKSLDLKRFLTYVQCKSEKKTKPEKTVSIKCEDNNMKESVSECIGEEKKKESETNSYGLWNVYWNFFSIDGNIVYLYASISLSIMTGFLFVGSDYWLKHWMRLKSNCYESHQPVFESYLEYSACAFPNMNISMYSYCYRAPSGNHCVDVSNSYYFTIYAILIVFTLVCGLARNVFGTFICTKVAEKLHDKMLRRIMYAPMYFFNTKPIGRVLERFTNDMFVIDTCLPLTFSDFSNGVCLMVVALGMIYTERFQIIYGTITLFLAMQHISRFYMPTMRALRHMKSKANSTVCSHLSISLDGLTTIRAHRATERYRAIFGDLQSDHTYSSYTLKCVEIWFTLYGELICVSHVISAILLFVVCRDDESAESAGFIIAQMIKLFPLIPFILTLSTTFQNDFTSAERIMEYINLPTERFRLSLSDDESLTCCSEAESCIDWPQTGNIEFKNVCVKYSDNGNYALQDINFYIKNGEKIGIVGRTGAGKTSLISLIFGFMEPEGTIKIDGVDITKLKLETLRSKLSVIPQEPLVFIGTLRYNLDPFEEYPDDELWNCLEDVHLDHVVLKLPDGLNTKVVEGGLNFSYGQRQLICLVRVILRQNKILILDEATANVDMKTDHLIQETIRTKFKKCTVITIAHRLNNVVNCDRVMVMNDGKIAEFAPPRDLLSSKNSLFFKFAQDAGLMSL